MGGAAGGAFIFVSLLGLSMIVGGAVVAYAAHCFFTVVQDTAAGNEEVSWPGDLFLDWIRSAVVVIGLLAVSLAPAGFLARGLGAVWLPGQPGLRFFLMAVLSLWSVFPVVLLSIMSARSPWMLFKPAVIVQLVRLGPAALIFFLMSGLVGGICAGLAYLYLWLGQAWLLPVIAIVFSGSLLIYGRLLGRLAWLISRIHLPKDMPKRAAINSKRRQRKPSVSDPWAVPEERTFDPEVELPVEGYEVAEEGAVFEEAKSNEPMRERPTPYELSDEKPTPPPPTTATVSEWTIQRHLAERTRSKYIPPRPFMTGVYSFPLYATNLGIVFKLSVSIIILGCILMGMGLVRPPL